MTYGLTLLSAAAMFTLLAATKAAAHCDTLEGPVIKTARKALENGNIAPVLKWIREEDEPEVKKAFELALKVRSLGPHARELADTSFFETLVRIHRAGEGAPYEGLKPGSTVPPLSGRQMRPWKGAMSPNWLKGSLLMSERLLRRGSIRPLKKRELPKIQRRWGESMSKLISPSFTMWKEFTPSPWAGAITGVIITEGSSARARHGRVDHPRALFFEALGRN